MTLIIVTGRARGGNDIRLRFNGRTTNLHSVWDGLLVSKLQRTLDPTRIQYDDFLRYLLEELEIKYLNSTSRWLSCPYPARNHEQIVLGTPSVSPFVAQKGCVESWMEETHRLNCDGVWSFDTASVFRENFTVERDVVAEFWEKEFGVYEVHEEIYGEYFDVDLSEGEYWEWVVREDVVQRMLIRGGVRLAGGISGCLALSE
jgi:S1/P1 Nuclease